MRGEECRLMDGWDEVWQLLNTFASGETQKQWSRVEPTAMLGELYWRLAVLYDNQKKMLSSPTSLEPDPQWGALVPDDLIKACADNDELKSRLLAALSNTTPYLSQDVKGVYKYEIDSPDELDAGLHGFSDEVTVIVDSGEPGGDPTGEDSFEEYMRQALIEWFYGAKVVFKKAGE